MGLGVGVIRFGGGISPVGLARTRVLEWVPGRCQPKYSPRFLAFSPPATQLECLIGPLSRLKTLADPKTLRSREAACLVPGCVLDPAGLTSDKTQIMTEQYRVRVANDSTFFAAAHFITYDHDVCEALHGHNFVTAVTVEGPLNRNQYVVDFVALNRLVGELLAELDHRVLLPMEHDQIRVAVHGEEVEVRFPGRRWVFPRNECALLPLANTTVELLTRHLAQGLLARLSAVTGFEEFRVTVEIEESPGWSATCSLGSLA